MADRRTGPGQVLIGCYLLFVVAAGARSAVQLAVDPMRAPLAYGLSAVAALVYLAGALLLAKATRDPAAVRAAAVCCAVEFAGVLAVGVASLLAPSAFPDATVWSWFGAGYGFVPLVLPVFATVWLYRRTPS